ncbi:hypothetical protein [Novosphingobium resinovorum]|uniref:hypothetical protein n=1 Tax=Novosphingobium resinovorum TaxID=158500 RepID=UPI00192E6667|nr:hypothetical protein [Novosphingobium resinovorum]
MSDSALFISGSLFTTDYLAEAIKADPAYLAVDPDGLRVALEKIAAAFPRSDKTNESQTEDDFIWPVLRTLDWTESLRQQNLTVSGRDDVPDGLLFVDAGAKAAANALHEQWKRYAHGLAVIESKRWARPLDRASGRDEATAPSTQMLRYLRRIDDLTSGQLRWGILTNGAKWRLYWAGARSVSEEFLEIDLGRVLALDGGDDLFADEATREHWLRVFAVMFCRDAFIKTGTDNLSFHERAQRRRSMRNVLPPAFPSWCSNRSFPTSPMPLLRPRRRHRWRMCGRPRSSCSIACCSCSSPKIATCCRWARSGKMTMPCDSSAVKWAGEFPRTTSFRIRLRKSGTTSPILPGSSIRARRR